VLAQPLVAERSPPRGASLVGSVADPSGAALSGADVDLQCHQGREHRATVTDAAGDFRLEGLSAGDCEIQVHYEGFKMFTRRVDLGGPARRPLKVTLEIADIAEEVTVGRETSTAADENRDVVALDRKLLDDLPAFDQDYIATLSNFLDSAAMGSGGAALVVDGAEANRVLVSPSAIQEVKINQNPYSAEYFRPGRGRIEIITKQEAPEYHGTLSLLFRDSSLNAQAPLAPEKAPEQRRIFEGTLSGPVGPSKATTFLLSFNRKEEDVQSIVLAAGPDGEIRQNVPAPQRSTDFSARVTERFGARHTLWVQYALQDRASANQGVGGFTLPEAGSNSKYHEDNLDISDQFSASDKAINQLSLHLEWNHGATTSVGPGMKLVVQDAFTRGGAEADQQQTEMDIKLFDTASWSVGRHLIKAGVQVAEWSHRTYDDQTNRDGTFFFSSLESFELGQPYAFTQQVGNGHVALFQKILGGFVQDEVRLSRQLSIALGLRYDYQNLLQGGLFSPRAFAAFAPDKVHQLTLRGGLGVFNDRFPPSTFADIVKLDGQHLASYLLLDPTYPNVSAGGSPVPAQPTNLAQLDPTIRTPYTLQCSLGAEWQLAKGTSVVMTYRGSRGVSLLRSRDVNAPEPPGYAQRPDLAEGSVRQIESAGRQVGDALEVSFHGRVGKRFTGIAQYTLSRTENNTSGVNFFPARSESPLAEWGPADFDQRHRFNALGTFALGIVKVGVAVSAASGKPYTLTTGQDDNHDGLLTDRPPSTGRNSLRAPGFTGLDVTLSRDLYADKARGEKGPIVNVGIGAFNILNSFGAAVIEGNQSSPFYGQAISAVPSRRIQVSARVGF
jgi:Carboxypeptidase regulatory-like domain/TonB dependent receptor